MWCVEKLESRNQLILIQNGRLVRNENDVLIFIARVTELQDDETGRQIQVIFDDGSSLELSLDDFSPRHTQLTAEMNALDFAKKFAKEFADQLPGAHKTRGQISKAPTTENQIPAETPKKKGYTTRHFLLAGVGAVAAVVAAPVVLAGAGFTAGGIAAGSYGAGMMSAAAVANGGGVAAGSAVAILQSVGAVGLGVAGTAAVGGAGAAVVTGVAAKLDKD